MFPANHRVLKYYSLCMIVCQKNVDYDNHLKIPFGTYVLSNNEPNPMNTNVPRQLEFIYMRATDSTQGDHKLLHLYTNSVITRNCVTSAPITPIIINQVQPIFLYGSYA